MQQSLFLVSVERDQKPYTLNHCFNENLRKARGTRLSELLKKKARNEYDPFNERTGKFVLELRQQPARARWNLFTEEIHDILKSYYQVAQKRFVDNVYRQTVDHCLLTGLMCPLAVFTQEWVINLNAEQLETIAGELPTTREHREELQAKIEDLAAAMEILKR